MRSNSPTSSGVSLRGSRTLTLRNLTRLPTTAMHLFPLAGYTPLAFTVLWGHSVEAVGGIVGRSFRCHVRQLL